MSSPLSKLISSLPILSLTTQTLPYFHWTTTTSSPPSTPPHPPSTPTPPTQLPLSTAFSPTTTTPLRTFITTSTHTQKSLFFFGEHHHSPSNLTAQLQILDELLRIGHATRRPVHLVLEMCNIQQQGALDRLGERVRRGEGDEAMDEFLEVYEEGKEGFGMRHYLPLIMHAASFGDERGPKRIGDGDVDVGGVEKDEALPSRQPPPQTKTPHPPPQIHAAFPPRPWASYIAKHNLPAFHSATSPFHPTLQEFERAGFDRWTDLGTSKEYKSFLRSLMKSTQPEPSSFADTKGDEGGIFPAQAFKDSVAAWVLDSLRCEQPLVSKCSATLYPSASDDTVAEHDTTTPSPQPAPPLVLCILGAGHCQYSFGVVERLRAWKPEEVCVIVAKERGEGVWKGEGWGEGLDGGGQEVEDGKGRVARRMADAVFVYDDGDGAGEE